MLRLIIVLHVVESIEFVEDKNLLIHRTLGADRTAYSLSIRIYGDSSQLSFFVSSFRERLLVLATFSERTRADKPAYFILSKAIWHFLLLEMLGLESTGTVVSCHSLFLRLGNAS